MAENNQTAPKTNNIEKIPIYKMNIHKMALLWCVCLLFLRVIVIFLSQLALFSSTHRTQLIIKIDSCTNHTANSLISVDHGASNCTTNQTFPNQKWKKKIKKTKRDE